MRKILLLLAIALPLFAWPQHWRIQIAGPDEPGQRLVVAGRVFGPDGKPMSGVAVHAYHTDAKGLYHDSSLPSDTPPRLQGWLRCDTDGSYEIDTIKPAPYPGRSIPAHIHFQFQAPGLPNQSQTVNLDRVKMTTDAKGVLHIQHDFQLSMDPPEDR